MEGHILETTLIKRFFYTLYNVLYVNYMLQKNTVTKVVAFQHMKCYAPFYFIFIMLFIYEVSIWFDSWWWWMLFMMTQNKVSFLRFLSDMRSEMCWRFSFLFYKWYIFICTGSYFLIHFWIIVEGYSTRSKYFLGGK